MVDDGRVLRSMLKKAYIAMKRLLSVILVNAWNENRTIRKPQNS